MSQKKEERMQVPMLDSVILMAVIIIEIVACVRLGLALVIPLLMTWLIMYIYSVITKRDWHTIEGYALDGVRAGFQSIMIVAAAGTLIGGTYEYICSVFTELVFGAVFWDYSHIPFNIAGRVNLLYCFFWGIAAVIWIKKLYPPLHNLLAIFYRWEHWVATSFIALFMAADILISCGALIRYDARSYEISPRSGIGVYLDKIYDDAAMEKIYPGEKRRQRNQIQ